LSYCSQAHLMATGFINVYPAGRAVSCADAGLTALLDRLTRILVQNTMSMTT
jgi:hypothetical protein